MSDEVTVKTIYVCMGCNKLYEENPVECKADDGMVHSRFSSDTKCMYTKSHGHDEFERTTNITDWIFPFKIGQYKESLKDVPKFIGQTPVYALRKNGFKFIKEFQHPSGGSFNKREIDNVKREVSRFIRKLNSEGRTYVLFSETEYPGITHYAFLEPPVE